MKTGFWRGFFTRASSVIGAFLAITTLGLGAVQAAQTVTYTSSVVLTDTDWVRSLSLPAFNPAQGTLLSVDITVVGTDSTYTWIESHDTVPRLATTGSDVSLTVLNPLGAPLTALAPLVRFANNLSAFDGLDDFGGTSGVKNLPQARTLQSVKSLVAPTDDLSPYIGVSPLSFAATAKAKGFFTGPGDYLFLVRTSALVSVTVVYTYEPPAPSPCVPDTNASIGDFVWNDTNRNGRQDAGESGVDGVTVELHQCSDNGMVATTTTAGGGLYGFTVAPGDYYVKVVIPAGYVATIKNAPGTTVANDSDIDATGRMACTTLAPGANDPTWDAGIYVPPAPDCVPDTFAFSGNSPLFGPVNTRTFVSANGVTVKVTAFSRTKDTGIWEPAYLGLYGGGLGVTDTSEGTGGGNSHTVDNIGRDNYVLFEFSEPIILNSASLGYVVTDSDMSVWVGTFADPFNNHLNLSDSVLASFGFSEVNLAPNSAVRTANLNAGGVVGNAVVIAARVRGSQSR